MPRPDASSLTYLDRHGPDGGVHLRTVGLSAFAGAITTGLVAASALVPPTPSHPILRAVGWGIASGVAMHVVLRTVSEGAGAAFLSFVMPHGVPPEPEYSRLEALVARGDVATALAGFEAVIAAHPGESIARLRAAELYVRQGDPRRAESLLQEIQRHPARTDAHDLRAANRLVDLYLGPLDEPGNAMRELRRIADAHRGTPVGDGAREAILRLKTAT